MDKEFINEAQKYINHHSKYYKNFFYNRNINYAMCNVTKILEKRMLKINTFCYYINSSFSQLSRDFRYYLYLTKDNRKHFNFYQISLIKIQMYIYCIFREIDNIKHYMKNK